MDYLVATVTWFIVSLIGYFSFSKDWKSLKNIQQWFIIINLGLSLFSILNYFI